MWLHLCRSSPSLATYAGYDRRTIVWEYRSDMVPSWYWYQTVDLDIAIDIIIIGFTAILVTTLILNSNLQLDWRSC